MGSKALAGAAHVLVMVLAAGLTLAAEQAKAPDAQWKSRLEAGKKAYEAAQYDQAEKMHSLALEIAEAFGPEDVRLALTLNELAVALQAQGKYTQAEPLYQRALAIREKALGPDHPGLVTVLENYAQMLEEAKREAEAKPLLERANAIRQKAGGVHALKGEAD